MSPCTSLPRSSPRPGRSPWEEPTWPRAPLCRAESSLRRRLGRVPGRAGASKPLQALPLGPLRPQRTRGEPTDTHRAAAARLDPERTAREATQVPPQRGREFECRSGKGPRLPATPAHRQPLGGRGAASCERGPRGPQPARAFQRPAGSRGRAERQQPREGTGRADQEFFQWVETRASDWNPAIGGSAGDGGNLAALRAGTRGKGCGGGRGACAPLMINARGWGERAAPAVSARPNASRPRAT